MKYEEIITRAKLKDSDILCIFLYGSRIYGTFHKNSDYDFICVLKNKTTEQFTDNKININFYTQEEHQKRLDEHEITALECYFLEPKFILKQSVKFTFNLDLSKLRSSLSAKSSNSWVKCKKKLTIKKDFDLNIGRKSLFHSFRIIEFGMQIAKEGKIINYGGSNALFNEIMNNYYDWETIFENYKQRYNNLLTEFRKLAPK